jgi:hypothetical protein
MFGSRKTICADQHRQRERLQALTSDFATREGRTLWSEAAEGEDAVPVPGPKIFSVVVGLMRSGLALRERAIERWCVSLRDLGERLLLCAESVRRALHHMTRLGYLEQTPQYYQTRPGAKNPTYQTISLRTPTAKLRMLIASFRRQKEEVQASIRQARTAAPIVSPPTPTPVHVYQRQAPTAEDLAALETLGEFGLRALRSLKPDTPEPT